ncbi:ABC transporter substrate-binding protein [Methylogaea oryzae]|uniref:ABC transporter substrate-binding protein n=1 Tax=Methylogaea oryzae TaxID=1295382 RepID=UPI001FE69382|nr:ABC transporter substrate-binding protein [Methylogaea oryzae]
MWWTIGWLAVLAAGLAGCDGAPWNSPYSTVDAAANTLYSSFSEQPKHLDPALSYNVNELQLIAQVYETPLQYHFLKKPYTLIPSAAALPEITYRDAAGAALPKDADEASIAYSDYVIAVTPGILYQPHPAFARDGAGQYLNHDLSEARLRDIRSIGDVGQTGTRELVAEDFVYQIKRLVHPKIHSPVAELMKQYIAGLAELEQTLADAYGKQAGGYFDLRPFAFEGAQALDKYRYRIRLKGKYPQFRFWLAMTFFAPVPWEAERFYSQPGLREKNITLDWFPVGTGPYMMTENNPNRRMVLARNPNFHAEYYPDEAPPEDKAAGLLADAGRRLPFIDRVVYILEKETIPYWNKFLQGYYDASGVGSDSFDQAIQFSQRGEAGLTPDMAAKDIRLETSITPSVYYMGFNMLDPTVGGLDEAHRKLRRAISIAIDYEEFISIFLNGRGIPAQGVLAPGLFGYTEGEAGINPYVYDWDGQKPRRKSIDDAKRLLAEAGYPEGRDAATGQPLVLYLDASSGGADDKSLFNWYRKQYAKLGIQLVIRTTDYNRFQQKIRDGNAQIFVWGWHADYPDPENFFFLLHGANIKVGKGGENASNYQSPEFDRLYEKMRNMDDTPQRQALIDQLQEIARRDAPWVFAFHPQDFALHHGWYSNLKPTTMAYNNLKFRKLDPAKRQAARTAWNEPLVWPLWLGLAALIAVVAPAWLAYRRRMAERVL